MIKCRKYIHAHANNHLVNKTYDHQQGKWCKKKQKTQYIPCLRNEGGIPSYSRISH